MYSFKRFILEEEQPPSAGQKLKHIAHPEDRPLMYGKEGFNQAHGALTKAHNHIMAGKNNSDLTMKYDGSPAVIFGHHPENGKFFVSTKSIGNKNPKINYSEHDIEENHGHAPGLVSKLKVALRHLPKVTPSTGVYHGDLMHSADDQTHHENGDVSFTPNTITYTAKGKEAAKIKKSRVGVVVHQQYHGKTIDSLHASPHVNINDFGEHPDVHIHGAEHDTSRVTHSDENHSRFSNHLAAANKIHQSNQHEMYNAMHPKHTTEKGHFTTYINSTVRNDTVPTVDGFKRHLQQLHQKMADKVKTEKSKNAKITEGQSQIAHVDSNTHHYDNLFKMHHHLQEAKHALVDSLESHQGKYQHHIAGRESKPEGFVVNSAHGPDKLVNRSEFARANLLKVK